MQIPDTITLPRTPPVPPGAEQDVPRLECHTLDGPGKKAAILICPGGGYEGRAAGHEGKDIAQKLNDAGMHAFILHYRVAPFRHPQPLQDAINAIRWIREHAEELNIADSSIAVMGFSAGGHLACSLGLLWDSPDVENSGNDARPDCVLLAYPVISSGDHAHKGSFNNLLSETATEEMRGKLSLENCARTDAPPFFIWHTAEDKCVPVENALLLRHSLAEHGIDVELHIYPRGNHGQGLAESIPGAREWFPRAVAWIKENM